MLQIDGSLHETRQAVLGLVRGARPVLPDDRRGRRDRALSPVFSKEETTWAALDLLAGWTGRYGCPQSVYVDRKSVYITEQEPTREEQLAGVPALTQFGRACHKLDIRIIAAHSPQAKGRVERKHGVCPFTHL